MSTTVSRRLGRRLTAMGAGVALVAAGLSLSAVAPAQAVSAVTGGVTDAFGNPLAGTLIPYELQEDGTYQQLFSDYVFVEPNGYIEGLSLDDGTYKFAFNTGSYTEFYEDQPDLAASQAVTVAGGAPVELGPWTVDQPYLVGTVTNGAGKPLADATINVYDAESGDTVGFGSNSTDIKGAFKIATQAAPTKLAFSASGYAGEFYNDKGSFSTADTVGALPTGGNVGNVVLTAGGSISGQVTSDAGAPLEFVRVRTGTRSYDHTNKDGVYTIKNVSTGNHQITFADPIGEYGAEVFNNLGAGAEGEPTLVVVGPDQAVGNINANLTPLPADPTRTVEVTGSVKDSLGAPVVGAAVSAITTPAGGEGDAKYVDTAYSNRQGIYNFTELEKVQGENAFKIQANASDQGDDDAFDLFGTYFGGGQSYDASPAVTVTPGTPVGAIDFNLDRAGGVAGSLAGIAGAALEPSVQFVGVTDGVNAGGAFVEPDSTFESRSLRPGTYKVRFSDSTGNHAGEWWKDKGKFDDAVEITVKPGQLVSGLNAVLGNQLAATERPEIASYPWVGKALTADSGIWNLQTGTSFKYEWLVGSTVVGQGDSFTPTTSQLGDRLTLRVTAENGRILGAATSAASAKVGYQPKVKVKLKGTAASFKVKANPVKAKKVKGTVVVKEIVKVSEDGTIKYKKVAKAKIKKGKGAVKLNKLKKGKHKLVFFFTGKGKVGSTEVAKKVKVKR